MAFNIEYLNNSALIFACWKRNMKLFQLLMAQEGIDINGKNIFKCNNIYNIKI